MTKRKRTEKENPTNLYFRRNTTAKTDATEETHNPDERKKEAKHSAESGAAMTTVADDSHDLNYKMSKKIAQLTKVIYQLNCRNEDNDATLRTVAERYENEIAEIMSDARTKITTLRDQLASKNDTAKMDLVIKELTAKHQKEKEEAIRLFEEFKMNATRNEANARQKFEERIQNATREVTAAKEQFQKALEEIRAKQQAAAANSHADAETVRRMKDKEMNDLVLEYNERYKAMMSEQMDAQDRMQRELTEEWQAKLETLKKEHERLAADLRGELKSKSDEILALKRSVSEKNSENGELSRKIAELEMSLEKQRQKEIALSSNSSELVAEAEKTAELVQSLKSKISHLENQLKMSESSLSDANNQLDSAKQTLERQTSQITHLENEMSVLKAEKARLEEEARQKGNAATAGDAQLRATSEKLAAAEAKLAAANTQITSLQAKVAELTAALERLKADNETLKKTHEEAISNLKRAHQTELSKLSENANSSSSSLLQSHQQALAALRADLEKLHAEALSVKDKEAKAASTAAAEALAKAKVQHADEVKKLKATHDAAEAALKSELADVQGRLAADASSAQKEVVVLTARVKALEEELAAERSAHADSIKKLKAEHAAALQKMLSQQQGESASAMKDTAAKHAKDMEALRKELDEAKRASDEAIRNLQRESEASIAALKKAHAEELAANLRSLSTDTNSRHEAEMAKLRRELSEQLSAMRLSHEREMADKVRTIQGEAATAAQIAANKIRSLEAEIEALNKSSSANQQAAGSELAALKDKMARDLAASTRLFEQTIADVKKEAAEAAAESKRRHDEDVQRLTKEIEELKRQHEEQFTKLSEGARSAQKDIEENYKNRIASLEKRKEEERTKQLGDLKAAYEKEISGVKKAAEAEASSLSEANARLSSEIAALSASFQNVNQLLDKTAAELAAMKTALIAKENELANTIKVHHNQMEQTRRSLEIDRNQAIAAIHAQHQAETERALASFEEERNDLNGKIKQLRRHIADLEYKYANRESRAEDVEKINALLRDLKEKDEALMKAYNDMKFYKLELLNREESYNKMFGRQPTVATADATTKPLSAPPTGPAPPKTFGIDATRGRKSIK